MRQRPLVLVLFVLASFLAAERGGAQLPWEVWLDLASLARLDIDDQVILRSSHCPSGCALDRHSATDSRFVRVLGDEGVIFEDAGPGAITRIWMTMGDGGISTDLDPSISIRITIDNSPTPVVDLPLPTLFNGSTPPFLPPLVGNRVVSSGGNYCYVPIPYRQACRVSLVGAGDKRIWFQITHHRLADAAGVTSFTGTDDWSRWAALLAAPGSDPWPVEGPDTLSGTLTLTPGATVELANLTGPDSLEAVRFGLPRTSWPAVRLTLAFDGQETVDLPVADFFAVGRASSTPTRSLLVGVTNEDLLYCYFPMPFFRLARVWLSAPSGGTAVEVAWELRRAGRPPAADSGYFAASRTVVERSVPGADTVVLDRKGQGKWVGLFAEAGSVDGGSRQYLEGDERVYLDGSRHPGLYGTGVEDFFGGGFYFRVTDFNPVPFRLALHGMTYDLTVGTDTAVGMYRLLLTDAPTSTKRLRVGFENGPLGDLSMRWRAVAYSYFRPRPALASTDVLDIGSAESRAEHAYEPAGPYQLADLEAAFEGEPPVWVAATGCYEGADGSQLVLGPVLAGERARLRRLFDAGVAGQEAAVEVDGAVAARLGFAEANPFRRWRELDVPLVVVDTEPLGALQVRLRPEPGVVFNEFRYELWTGFETGTCDVELSGACEAADLAALDCLLSGVGGQLLGNPDTNGDGTVSQADLARVLADIFHH